MSDFVRLRRKSLRDGLGCSLMRYGRKLYGSDDVRFTFLFSYLEVRIRFDSRRWIGGRNEGGGSSSVV